MELERTGPSQEPSRLGQPSYQRVRDAIRGDIATGAFPSGTRLKLHDLTRRYGLSPAPIREALSQLEAEGWIVIAPNRGASVRIIDEAMLRELNEVRVALESYFVRLAADAATSADLRVLTAIQDEYEAAIGTNDTPLLVRLNSRFHDAIRAMHVNGEAASIIRRHGQFFSVMRSAWGYQPGRPEQIAREHRAMLAAFSRNDGDAAERVSRQHIQHALEDLLVRWRAGQGLGEDSKGAGQQRR